MSKTNPYFQSNRRGGSAVKARIKVESQCNQTPKMLIQNSADEKLLRENPIQLRQSPSFKLKNVRHVTPGNKDEVKRQLMYQNQETYARKTRISVLESFYHQIGTDEDVSKNTQQVKKNPVATPSSSQTTSVPKQLLESEERDLEEMHFQFVEMQQKYKGWLENIERRSKINQ